MDCFVLLAYASLKLKEPFCNDYYPVWTLLQIKKIYSVGTKKKSDFFELWQLHKQLKTMEMSQAWPNTFDKGYIHWLQPERTHKIH